MTDWNENDSVVLRDFLDTQAGQKLMELIARPDSQAKTFEEVALNARFADGIDHVKKLIKKLETFRPVKTVESTQPIDWNESK